MKVTTQAINISNKYEMYAAIARDYISFRDKGAPEKSFIIKYLTAQNNGQPVKQRTVNDWFNRKGIYFKDGLKLDFYNNGYIDDVEVCSQFMDHIEANTP